MFSFICFGQQWKQLVLVCCFNFLIKISHFQPALAIVFDEVYSLHVWLTVSSLANRDPSDAKSLLFRQIELNWINAPLEDDNDYIGLYLDGQPDDENIFPVSVHRLNGQSSGQIMTDFYLPQIDFYNETSPSLLRREEAAKNNPTPAIMRWNEFDASSSGSMRRLGRSQHLETHPQVNQLQEECLGYCLAYHSRNKILAKNCLKTNPTWMLDSFREIGSRSLPAIMIPGTHNSGTYSRQLDKSALHMINKYQMNQDESIFNQLLMGIRHLDLRIGYSKVKQRPERLWIYHDIFRTEVSAREVFEQVRRFLELTSHEIIIMDFHRFTVGFQNENQAIQRERHSKLIELIFNHLGPYIVPSYLGYHAPLHEYIQMGKRLIVGYAKRGSLLSEETIYNSNNNEKLTNSKQVRDIDASKQDQDEAAQQELPHNTTTTFTDNDSESQDDLDQRVGTRLYNKLKSLKLISNSFSKRSIDLRSSMKLTSSLTDDDYATPSNLPMEESLARVALFFGPVRHLWPNKDTVQGLAQYMNETTCRKYFGDLRSMMAEMTPTVFGAISDKYDGNRRLAQLANRPVTDWIRDRWLHCINIVASDYFLGNDLIRLSIYANKMRHHRHQNHPNDLSQCRHFRHIEHLLDKSKIPIQFATSSPISPHLDSPANSKEQNTITHTSSDGKRVILKPLTPSFGSGGSTRDKRDSFVENVFGDGFSNLVSSFKRLLNL